MTKMTGVLLILALLVPFASPLGMARAARPEAPQAQAGQPKQPQWKSRAEYDDYQAMATEKDPNKRITLAQAVLQKYADSDFKDLAYVTMMGAYQQVGKSNDAIEAGRKALQANPDNIDALAFLSYVFPFVFKSDGPSSSQELSTAEANAKHGLEMLQKAQKPTGVTDEQFSGYIKPKRAVFNEAAGFAALQRKDYASAITSFKAATEDDPTDFRAFYRMGLSYLFSNPRDYDHAVWSMARSVSLAKGARDPNGEVFEKYLRRTYVDYHGNDRGLSEIITQAASSPNPPEGFKVAAMEKPKPTGNQNIDAFNDLTFPLKLGGEKADQQWQGLKGQELQLGGSVEGVEKGTDAGEYLVRIAILEQSKAAGAYDIELKDSAQPNVKNLSRGDLVAFKGTLMSYTATPNLILTVNGEVTTTLPDAPPAAKKPPARKPPAKRTTTRKAQQ